MYHPNDDLKSEDEEKLMKQTEGCYRRDVLLIEKVEETEVKEERLKTGYIAATIKGIGVPQRWVFAVMGCLGVTNAFMMRVCLSLAITEMVTKTKTSLNHSIADDTCTATTESTFSNSSGSGTYEWSEYTQGIILSSFFWGYIITHVPGGLLADKFGGKYTLGLGVFSTAIFTLLTPPVVHTYGSTGLIILRVLMGFGEGTTYPAVSTLIAEWAPPLERAKIGSLVMSGTSLGTVLGNAISGVLIRNSSIGWPIVFYVLGLLGVLWFLAWVLFCYSNPLVHPFISQEEKEYLHNAMKNQTRRKIQPTPWRHIITSVPMWALVVGKIGNSWGFQTMISDLPKYMSSVLKFSIQVNGFLSALPYIVMCLMGTAFSWLADCLTKNNKVSRTNVRKTLNTIASIIPAFLVIAASYTGCDRTIVVILFTVSIGMSGASHSSTMINPNDLSPNYSGTLMAIGNGIASLTGVLAPYVVGVLTPNQTLSEWRLVFWISFVIYCLSALIYIVWADGEVQPWNNLAYDVDHETKIDSRNPVSEDLSSIKKLNNL